MEPVDSTKPDEDRSAEWLDRMKRSLEYSLNNEKEMAAISAEDKHMLEQYYPYICDLLQKAIDEEATRH